MKVNSGDVIWGIILISPGETEKVIKASVRKLVVRQSCGRKR
jgi:hypothetical protein